MTNHRNTEFTVVAGVDESEMAETVLEHTLDLVNRHENARLHVLNVVTPRRGILHRSETLDGRMDEVQTWLAALVNEKLEDFEAGSSAGTLAVRVHVRDGIAAEEIVSLAAECEADVILMGRHGAHRRHRFLVGTVPERVLKTASCTVSIVQATDYGEHEAMTDTPCPACEAMRRDSNGERWFCDEHTEGRTFRSTSLVGIARTGDGRLA